MDNTTLPGIPANIEDSTAPLLLGCILNWGLYGGLCVQIYYYYIAFPKDRLVTKGLVYGLFLIETVQSILIAHDIYTIFAVGFGDIKAIVDPQLTWLDGPVIAGIVSSTVQIYFAHRIHKISGSKIAGVVIVILALVQGIAAIVSGVKALQLNDVTVLQDRAHISITIWLVGSAACDIIIAVFLVYYLWRRATGFKATQALITKVMRLTVETGSLTATIAILDVVLFLALPDHNYHVTPALILGKLYSNTLVTTLNSRLAIVHGRNDDVQSYRLESSGQVYVDKTQRVRVPGVNARTRKDDATVNVNVNIEREVWMNDIPMDRLDTQESSRSKVKTMNGMV